MHQLITIRQALESQNLFGNIESGGRHRTEPEIHGPADGWTRPRLGQLCHSLSARLPIMVPGQVIMQETIDYMRQLDVKEIHEYDATEGLKLVRADAVAKRAASGGAYSLDRCENCQVATPSMQWHTAAPRTANLTQVEGAA